MVVVSTLKDVEVISEVFQFEDFPKAYDHLKNGKPKFRCVVDVGTWARKNGFHKDLSKK